MVGREVDGQHVLSLHFCLLYVRLMVEFEVDGPLWVVLGRFRGLCGWSWSGLGASVGGLGPLSGPMWAVLGCLGASVGSLGKGSGRQVAQIREGKRSGKRSGRKVLQIQAGKRSGKKSGGRKVA